MVEGAQAIPIPCLSASMAAHGKRLAASGLTATTW
jgi:hypothetical protein